MSRAFKIGGGLAAVGAGYYFYQAGGDPKGAQKRFEGTIQLSPLTLSHC
jgi:hypothetical protein